MPQRYRFSWAVAPILDREFPRQVIEGRTKVVDSIPDSVAETAGPGSALTTPQANLYERLVGSIHVYFAREGVGLRIEKRLDDLLDFADVLVGPPNLGPTPRE